MMYWIIPAWVVSLIGIFFLGYYLGSLKQQIVKLKEVIERTTIKTKEEEPESPSTLIDPNDPIQEAIYEHKKMMEQLNGKENSSN